MKALSWFSLVCVATLFGHYYMYSQGQITGLRTHVELTDKMATVERDTVRDLLHANQQLASKLESEKTQAYVSGAVAAIQDTDNVDKIWHAGYDRGTEVQMLVQTSEKKQADEALGY